MQHLNALNIKPEIYKPKFCPHPDCGMAGLWCHGCYFRKPDRENPSNETLNPIPILRFYCKHCRCTCSVLPECMSPKRWYLWKAQQATLLLWLTGLSFNAISKKIKPSRTTIRRWMRRWSDAFNQQALHLKSFDSALGYQNSFEHFWSTLLGKIPLSTAMFRLWASHCPIP